MNLQWLWCESLGVEGLQWKKVCKVFGCERSTKLQFDLFCCQSQSSVLAAKHRQSWPTTVLLVSACYLCGCDRLLHFKASLHSKRLFCLSVSFLSQSTNILNWGCICVSQVNFPLEKAYSRARSIDPRTIPYLCCFRLRLLGNLHLPTGHGRWQLLTELGSAGSLFSTSLGSSLWYCETVNLTI